MGNGYTKMDKAILYEWSTSEFPQEYAFIYTALDDESKTIIFRFSVNKYKVLCRHVDNRCKHHPARFQMKVTAETDNKGNCKFGQVNVAADGIKKIPEFRDKYVFFRYDCEESGGDYTVDSYYIDQNMGRGNFMKTRIWEFSHTFYTSSRTEARTYVRIQCNKVTGLCIRFNGPFIYKGVISPEERGLLLRPRMVFAEPPKAFNEDVQSDCKEICIVLQQGMNKVTNVGSLTSSEQATGRINDNTGLVVNNTGRTHGNLNGSLFLIHNLNGPLTF